MAGVGWGWGLQSQEIKALEVLSMVPLTGVREAATPTGVRHHIRELLLSVTMCAK